MGGVASVITWVWSRTCAVSAPRSLLRMHLGARLPGDRGDDVVEIGDHPAATGGRHESADGVDLGPHRSLREVTFGSVLTQLPHRDVAERLRIRLTEAEDRTGHVGGDHQHLGLHETGEQLSAEVLVDDGWHPRPGSVRAAYDGHPTTAVGDHHEAGLDQRQRRRSVQDLAWRGRRHYPPPPLRAHLPPGLAVLDEHLGLILREVPPDRLRRTGERRILGVDNCAGDHGG